MAAWRGDAERAKTLYAQAAATEELALDAVPHDKPRTRGAITVSTAALWLKAERLNETRAFVLRAIGDNTYGQ